MWINFLKRNELIELETKLSFVEPNYDGIAKVLEQINGLYKVCDNKELIDKLLQDFMSNRIIIK